MRAENKEIIDYKSLGTRIKEKRLDAGMNIKQLSVFSNVDEASLSNIERGTKRSGLTSLVLISRALGVSIDYLLFGSEESMRDDKSVYFDFNLNDYSIEEKKAIIEVVSTLVQVFPKNMSKKTL